MRDQLKKHIFYWAMFALLFLLIELSLTIGAYDWSPPQQFDMFWTTRLPRTVAILIAGAGLSVSGLVIQTMTQNHFAEPTTTGSLDWAGLGLLTAYLLWPNPSILLRMVFAVLFCVAGSYLFFIFINRLTFKSPLLVPIFGIVSGTIVSAITQMIAIATNRSQSLEIWFTGSFAHIERHQYEILWLVIPSIFIFYRWRHSLSVVGLGEDFATNLGINYHKVLLLCTFLVALNVGVIASVVGYVPFLGLIVPNLVKSFSGDLFHKNFFPVIILGMIITLAVDIFGRTIIAPFEIPISFILGAIGPILIIYLVFKGDRQYDTTIKTE